VIQHAGSKGSGFRMQLNSRCMSGSTILPVRELKASANRNRSCSRIRENSDLAARILTNSATTLKRWRRKRSGMAGGNANDAGARPTGIEHHFIGQFDTGDVAGQVGNLQAEVDLHSCVARRLPPVDAVIFQATSDGGPRSFPPRRREKADWFG